MSVIERLEAERQRVGNLSTDSVIYDCVLQACLEADHYLVEYQDGPIPLEDIDAIHELIDELSFYR